MHTRVSEHTFFVFTIRMGYAKRSLPCNALTCKVPHESFQQVFKRDSRKCPASEVGRVSPPSIKGWAGWAQKLEDLKLKTVHVKLIQQDMYVAAKPASMTVKDMSTCTATEQECCENFKEIFKREN